MARKKQKSNDQPSLPVTGKLPNPAERKELVGRVVSINNDWMGSVITGMTPSRLASVLSSATAGDTYAQSILFEEMEERDAHLFSVLQTRKLAVVNRPIKILPASEEPRHQEQAEFIQNIIEEMPDFQEDIQDMLDCIGKGFSVLEIEWDYRGKRLMPVDLHWIPQHKFIPDPDNPYKKFRLLTKDEPVNGIELNPYKFITHIYRAKSGVPARGGILRVCAWMYLFKHYAIKDWMIFLEIYGIPLRLGTYNSSTSKPDLEVLKQAVRNLGSDAAAVITDSTAIKIIESVKTGGGGNPHENLASLANAEISKAVLGQTSTADATPGKLGNESEKEHVREDLRNADIRALEKRLQRVLFKSAIDLNFGVQDKYPRAKIDIEKPEDLKNLAERDRILVKDVGLPVSKKYFYEKYGIPEPQAGDDIITPASEASFKNPFKIGNKQ